MGNFKLLILLFGIAQTMCSIYKTNFIRHDKMVQNVFNHNITSRQLDTTTLNCTNVGQNSPQCDYNGICLQNGNCKCNNGYITFPDSHNIGCNYKQKSKWVAFLLSFFLGPEGGAGEWYLGNNQLALGQLLFTWVSLIVIGMLSACTEGSASVLAFPWLLGVFIWWLCDWILIINNKTDGNGAPTYDGFN